MDIRVELYGGLRRRVDGDEIWVSVDANAPTVGDVVDAIETQYPQLEGVLDRVARAVDDEIVDDDHRLGGDSTMALLPPVSGGSGVEPSRYLSAQPLDRGQLIDETADDRCGALVVFSGDIRDHNAGRDDVVAIDYEAHEVMAARELECIEREVVEEFDVLRCRIQHRTGRVEVGESSVLVVCRAPHRDAAFEGARYGIDELKKRTPLWKKECYANGDCQYLDGTSLRED